MATPIRVSELIEVTDVLDNDEFLVARSGGSRKIKAVNLFGASLLAANNLDDLVDVPTARDNLDVYSRTEVGTAIQNATTMTESAILTLNNGFTLATGIYVHKQLNHVHFWGRLGTAAATLGLGWTLAFNIEAAYRPQGVHHFLVPGTDGAVIAGVRVEVNGNVSIKNYVGSILSDSSIDLTGVSFMLITI